MHSLFSINKIVQNKIDLTNTKHQKIKISTL
jgi:hypothetical protein